jgi:hypothetical protein
MPAMYQSHLTEAAARIAASAATGDISAAFSGFQAAGPSAAEAEAVLDGSDALDGSAPAL